MTPLPTYEPCGKIQFPWSGWMQFARHSHHVIDRIMFGQPTSQEYPSKMHIVSDVTSAKLANFHIKIPNQNLDGHGSLLLSYALEVIKSLL